MKNKDKVNELFTRLRAKSYVAVQDHLCCSTCATADLDHRVGRIGGAVYYHRQDTETADSIGKLYLRFFAGVRADARWIGQDIVDVCQDLGLEFEWNGDAGRCVIVDLNP